MTIGNIEIDLSENTLVLTFDYVALEKNYAIQCYIEGDVVYYIKAYVDGNYEFLGTKRLPAEIKELVPSKKKVEKMFITNNGEISKKLNLFLIENMLGVTPEFISSLKEEFEKLEHKDSEMLICWRICDEMKDIMNIPDDDFNKYPWVQVGVRGWKNNKAQELLFTFMTTIDDIKATILDLKTLGEEWIKQLIDKYGEIKWPDEEDFDDWRDKILDDDDLIYSIRRRPDFEWKNGRIVEGPDLRQLYIYGGGRIKWESIYEGLKKIMQAK